MMRMQYATEECLVATSQEGRDRLHLLTDFLSSCLGQFRDFAYRWALTLNNRHVITMVRNLA